MYRIWPVTRPLDQKQVTEPNQSRVTQGAQRSGRSPLKSSSTRNLINFYLLQRQFGDRDFKICADCNMWFFSGVLQSTRNCRNHINTDGEASFPLWSSLWAVFVLDLVNLSLTVIWLLSRVVASLILSGIHSSLVTWFFLGFFLSLWLKIPKSLFLHFLPSLLTVKWS